jgi:hypothetical protein
MEGVLDPVRVLVGVRVLEGVLEGILEGVFEGVIAGVPDVVTVPVPV